MKPATSIEKVCRVLDAFRSKGSMGITEITDKTGLLPSGITQVT